MLPNIDEVMLSLWIEEIEDYEYLNQLDADDECDDEEWLLFVESLP